MFIPVGEHSQGGVDLCRCSHPFEDYLFAVDQQAVERFILITVDIWQVDKDPVGQVTRTKLFGVRVGLGFISAPAD